MSPREPLSTYLWAICNDIEAMVPRWPERDRTLRASLEQLHAAARLVATWVDTLDDPSERPAYADRSVEGLLRNYEDARRVLVILRVVRTSIHRALNDIDDYDPSVESLSATELLQVLEGTRRDMLDILRVRAERVEDDYGPKWPHLEKEKGRPRAPLPHDRVMQAIRAAGRTGIGINGLLRALGMKHELLHECLKRLQLEKRVRCKRGPRNAQVYFATDPQR